jgi:hypothetical protein
MALSQLQPNNFILLAKDSKYPYFSNKQEHYLRWFQITPIVAQLLTRFHFNSVSNLKEVRAHHMKGGFSNSMLH